MLLLYCKSLDRLNEIEVEIRQHGLTVTTQRTGMSHLHPLLGVEIKLRSQILKLEKQFDFTKPKSALEKIYENQ